MKRMNTTTDDICNFEMWNINWLWMCWNEL